MAVKVVTTIISAATSYDLVSLAAVKDELGIQDNSKDATLSRYISAASAAAAQYCNRKFQAEELQDEIWIDRDPIGSPVLGCVDVLRLSRWPVENPIISVVENGVTLVEGTDFKVDYDTGELIRLGDDLYPRKWRAVPIVVQFVGGFNPIPNDIQDAIVRMVTRRYASKGRDPNLKQQNIPGVIEQSWWVAGVGESGNLSPDIEDVLDNYRTPVVA